MISEKDVHPFKRFVLPILSCVGAVVMIVASIASHGMSNLYYLAVFVAVMLVGALCYRGDDGKALFIEIYEKITKKSCRDQSGAPDENAEQ